MIIKKSSWHYKWNSFFYDRFQADNLCQYFWSIIWAIVCPIGILSIFLILIIFLILAIMEDPWDFAVTMSLIGCVLFPIIAIAILRAFAPPEKTAIPTPNIVKEYYKAFKGKYCPRIEYED